MTGDEAIPEVAYGATNDAGQADLPLASDGVQRIVWRMRHGDILIEIRDGEVWVNGERVERVGEAVQNALPDANKQNN
jgi:hypothetical protein